MKEKSSTEYLSPRYIYVHLYIYIYVYIYIYIYTYIYRVVNRSSSPTIAAAAARAGIVRRGIYIVLLDH
jgi:hypothetical protein